jgi:transposase
MEESRYSSKTLDHLGLIAGLMKEIGVSEVIDSCYGEQSPDQIVSNGKALEAMILNGLGFVNKRLYLIPKFFEDKPISRLLGDGFEAGHFNDDRLGRALDAFYASGVTALFAKLSRRTFEVLGHKPTQGHPDTTTLSAYGEYNSASEEPMELHITQGYSKDHRPDLAQATLQLICDNLSGIPIYMEALDGNSNDRIKGNSELTGYVRSWTTRLSLYAGITGILCSAIFTALFASKRAYGYLMIRPQV